MTEIEKRIDAKLICSMVATGIMSFFGVVVETAMNVTFPTLMQEFQIDTATVQWITTGYLLVLAVIIPISAYLKRRFRTKMLFVTAICLFFIGTIMAALAPAFSWLLLGRLIQGVGTGIALPLLFNIVLEQAPKEKLGLMMGVASLITAIAPAVGPSLGGMIVNFWGWRMIFWVLLPFLFLAFFLGIFSIRQVSEMRKAAFPWRDYLLLAIGFICFIFAINQASIYGWLSWPVLGLFLVSIMAITLFYRCSSKAKNPLIQVQVFQYLPFSLSVIVLVLVQFICLSLGFLIPNYAQIVSGKTAFLAGCLLLPGCLLGAILAPIGGRILDAFGAKRPILLGNSFILLATICFSIFAAQISVGLFIGIYVFFALGQGFTMGNTMTNGLRQLPVAFNADGNAVFNTLQQLAGAVGTSVVTTIVAAAQAKLPNDLAAATITGTQSSFYLLAVLALGALCCSCVIFYLLREKKQTTAVKAKGNRRPAYEQK